MNKIVVDFHAHPVTAELEKVADSLDLNVIRFWEKEMK